MLVDKWRNSVFEVFSASGLTGHASVLGPTCCGRVRVSCTDY